MNDWKKIKHLYLRAGFGLSQDELVSKKKSKWSKEINQILRIKDQSFELSTPQEFSSMVDGVQLQKGESDDNKEKVQKAKRLTPLVNADWVRRMATTQDPLLEKMTLFWHGHFACQSKLPNMASIQINTLRKHALGNFRDLVVAISQDPSMILYLNNQQNSKKKPNENFARELMELFTIGIGNYTENDIKEAGRAFTGWRANPIKGKAEFIERRHDFGNKTFMGKTGKFNGEDIVDIILEQKQTARFISEKIYRYFVNARINDGQVSQMTDVFYESNYDISKLMQFVLKSDWFYDDVNMGVKIKSPIELLVGMMKTLKFEFKAHRPLLGLQKNLGQVLFNPPNVAGWPGDKAWIDNATLLTRLNMPGLLLVMNHRKGGKGKNNKLRNSISDLSLDISYFQNAPAGLGDAEIASRMVDELLQGPLTVRKEVLYARLRGTTQADRNKEILYRVMSLPEYQMC